MATDLQGNLTESKKLQMGLCVLRRPPALISYKAKEGRLGVLVSTHSCLVSVSFFSHFGKMLPHAAYFS